MRETIQLLTENLSENKYTKESILSTENNSLFTNNKSVIRAINEIYINQKALLNSIMIIYKKMHDSIGDVVENNDLKEAYATLEYANLIDGFIKVNRKLDDYIDLEKGDSSEVFRELKSLITNTDVDTIISVLNSLGWENVTDGLVKLNSKITDYISSDSQRDADNYISIRELISHIEYLLGSNDIDNKDVILTKYRDIMNAIVTLDEFTGYSEASANTLDQNGISNLANGILGIKIQTNGLSTTVADMQNNYTACINQINDISEVVQTLNNNLEIIQNSINNSGSSSSSGETIVSNSILEHKTNKQYQIGEIALIPELPNNMCLVCVQEGTTSNVRPDFASM